MSKSYKWKRVMKKLGVSIGALSIFGILIMNFSSYKAEAATANKEIVCSATAYAAGTMTASRIKSVRNENGISTVAVDPRMIPYGTYLYIEDYGYAVAADTGVAIKGYKLDLFFNSYSEACNWGKKDVKVIILGDSTNL